MTFQDNLASEEGLYKNIKAIAGFPPQTVQEFLKVDRDLERCIDALRKNSVFITDRIFTALTTLAMMDCPQQQLCLNTITSIRGLAYNLPDDMRPALYLNQIASESLEEEVRCAALEKLGLFAVDLAFPICKPVIDMLEKQAHDNSSGAVRADARDRILFISRIFNYGPEMLETTLRVLENGTHDGDLDARIQAFEGLTYMVQNVSQLGDENLFRLVKVFKKAVENGGPTDLLVKADMAKFATLERLARPGHTPVP